MANVGCWLHKSRWRTRLFVCWNCEAIQNLPLHPRADREGIRQRYLVCDDSIAHSQPQFSMALRTHKELLLAPPLDQRRLIEISVNQAMYFYYLELSNRWMWLQPKGLVLKNAFSLFWINISATKVLLYKEICNFFWKNMLFLWKYLHN